jgi:hypothetical protein
MLDYIEIYLGMGKWRILREMYFNVKPLLKGGAIRLPPLATLGDGTECARGAENHSSRRSGSRQSAEGTRKT